MEQVQSRERSGDIVAINSITSPGGSGITLITGRGGRRSARFAAFGSITTGSSGDHVVRAAHFSPRQGPLWAMGNAYRRLA